ncbi:MAG: hypothetical protein RIB59_01340 [Rhodospirillales bacterium]
MVGNAPPEFLADMVMNVTLQNGVFRITFGQLDSNNRAVPVARLLVPSNQLPRMLNGLANANKNIAAQLRERAAAAKAKADDKPADKKKK